MFHKKNLTEVIQILLKNGYALKFIFSTIQTKIKFLSNRDYNYATQNNKKVASNNQYFTISYVRTISESFIPIAFGK